MAEQLDMWPDTLMTTEKQLEEKLSTYFVMWRETHDPAALVKMRDTIEALMLAHRWERA